MEEGGSEASDRFKPTLDLGEESLDIRGRSPAGVRAVRGNGFRPWSRPDERSERKRGPSATHEKDVRTVFSVRNDDVV